MAENESSTPEDGARAVHARRSMNSFGLNGSCGKSRHHLLFNLSTKTRLSLTCSISARKSILKEYDNKKVQLKILQSKKNSSCQKLVFCPYLG